MNSQKQASRIYAYFAGLVLLLTFIDPRGNLADVALSFMVKDRLHASATGVAQFRLLISIPLFASVLFGVVRDHWSPFGLRDRGYFLIFGALSAAGYAGLGALPPSYLGLTVGMFTTHVFVCFAFAAYGGILALVGQEKGMSGRLSVVSCLASYAPIILGSFFGGVFAEYLKPATIFLILAGLAGAVALFSVIHPRAVFGQAYDQPLARAGHLGADIVRLFRSPSIYPPVIIVFLFNFSPGFNTPLQFYLTDHLHAPDRVYGEFFSIYFLGFVPFFFLYGWLLSRVRFALLLWGGMALSVPTLIPMFFLHSAQGFLIAAAPMGATAAIAWAAIKDLAIRSCPPGLQGALMSMVSGAGALSYPISDVLGARLYDASPRFGFYEGMGLSILATLMIFPVMLLIPRGVMALREGAPDTLALGAFST